MEEINEPYLDEYQKLCKECNAEFQGRLNQLFCTSKCKSQYNNRFARIERNATKGIDYILHNNRQILLALHHKDPDMITSEQELEEKGYDFQYQTHANGENTIYCYEYGLTKNKDGFKLTKKNGETQP